MFGSLYFILIKYQLCCQVSNAGTGVCVCVRVLRRDHFNCFLIPAESTLNTHRLINHCIKVCFYLCSLTMKTDFIYITSNM